MNSAVMATNLLGRPVRLREPPPGCRSPEGEIVLVAMDQEGPHFLLLVEGRLVPVEGLDQFVVLD